MTPKDRRYNTIKKLIQSGQINGMPEILDIVPPSTVARDLGFNYNRMKTLVEEPDKWVLKDVYKFADLIECDQEKLLLLIHQEHLRLNKKKR